MQQFDGGILKTFDGKISVCVYCGGQPLTNEHVIPKWISKIPAVAKILADSEKHLYTPHFLAKNVLDANGSTEGFDFVERGKKFRMNQIEVRVICKGCNEGWLSELEQTVAPILTKLINGGPVIIAPTDLETLAVWATKTAMMMEFNDRSTLSFSQEQFQQAFIRRHIPDNVTVHISGFKDENPLRMLHSGGRVDLRWPKDASGDAADLDSRGAIGVTAIVLGRVSFIVRNATHDFLLPDVAAKTSGSPQDWFQLHPSPPEWPFTALHWYFEGGRTHDEIFAAATLI